MCYNILYGSEKMNKLIKITVCILFEIILVLSVVLVKNIITINNELSAIENSRIENQKENINKISQKENILILGDSITELYPIDDIYNDLPVVKSGVSGYKTTDILSEIENMAYRYNPTKIILLIGINDIAYDTSQENLKKTISNIKEIVTKIKTNRCNAALYIESIYPINRELNENRVVENINESIIKVNDEIKSICKKRQATYINMHDQLIDGDGNFSSKYTDDGIHPNTLGYAKITRVLTPYIYDNYDLKIK